MLLDVDVPAKAHSKRSDGGATELTLAQSGDVTAKSNLILVALPCAGFRILISTNRFCRDVSTSVEVGSLASSGSHLIYTLVDMLAIFAVVFAVASCCDICYPEKHRRQCQGALMQGPDQLEQGRYGSWRFRSHCG